MGEDRTERLKSIDEALERMRKRGDDKHPKFRYYYENLKAKRDVVANGAPYTVYNITPYLVRAIGAQIPNCNIGKDGQSIPARGDWRKAVAPAFRDM